MRTLRLLWLIVPTVLGALSGLVLRPSPADSACCYVAAKDKDVQQPSQKVFITWDEKKNVETFTVQPKFEGNAADFGMIIPTPGKPKLDEMPRDFFKELAVFTILKRREQPTSRLLVNGFGIGAIGGLGFSIGGMPGPGGNPPPPRAPEVKVLEAGVVGALDYKIVEAGRADDLFVWLKENKYSYGGDEATLDFYVKKKWFFTVMKIDALQMKKRKDGSFLGELTPTRFQFTSAQLIYPLKITQLSVKEKTEALFYVQTAEKVDLPGELTYQYQWLGLLQNARTWMDKSQGELPGFQDEWLKATKTDSPAFLKRGEEIGYAFKPGRRPEANSKGHSPTTLEWAKRLTKYDIRVLKGESAYSDKMPDPDEGFTARDLADERKGDSVRKTIVKRQVTYQKDRPEGYLVREAPASDVKELKVLAGHLKEGQFLTKFRKTFTKDEMNDDLLIVHAKLGDAVDRSEYEEVLPSSPP
jgi:hypothetical protein